LSEAATPTATTRHGVILLLCAVMPIMAIISLVPVLPLLLEEFATTPGSQFLVPIALTIPALCVALFSPAAGWVSDKIGRKKLLVGALIVYAVAGSFPLFLSDLKQIIASRFVLGIVEAAIMTVATTLIGDYFTGERREKWIGVQIASGSFAAIILIAAGGFLGEALGSRGPFLLYGLAIPIALAAAIILYEPVILNDRPKIQVVPFPLKAVLPLILITGGVGLLFYSVVVQLGPILQLSGTVSPAMIGIAGAAANLGVVVGSLLFRWSIHRTGPTLLAAGLFISSIGYAGAGSADSFMLIALFAVVACIGSGLMLPNMLAWIMRHLPDEMRGRGVGFWTGAFFLGQFVAPVVATSLPVKMGGLANTLLTYAALAAVGAIITWRSYRKEATHHGRTANDHA
jgi:MFS family permease